jgi:predicted unusual protein kinase regulating ubiquinone biosynthesis (AarF/ABC1/UbiB family)
VPRAPSLPAAEPVVLPKPDRRRLGRRAFATVRVAVRHFRGLALRGLLRRPAAAGAFARPLRLTFESLGATYVKFGQLVASSPGVFGDAVANDFRSCLDTGPVVPFPAVRAAVEEAVGDTLAHAFRRFDEKPIGCASIAVVHRAELPDGRPVAVKVLRPGVEALVATDLRLMRPLFDFLALRVGVPAAGQLVRLLDGFREQVAEELDLRNEARAMEWFRALLRELGIDVIVVPATFPTHSGTRVLTMEYLDGVPIDDVASIAAFDLDPRPLMEAVVRAWIWIAVREGNFHGDVHAGNLLLLRDGRLGVLDWGIVGRLDAETHRFFRRTLEAALGEPSAWAEVAAQLQRAYGPALRDQLGLGETELAALVREVMEPLLTQPFGEASLGLLLGAVQGKLAPPGGPARMRGTSWQSRLRRLREQRRLHAGIHAHGAVGSSFDRGTFLLAKQLMYFERYGKMFMADSSLLADRGFLRGLLANDDG